MMTSQQKNKQDQELLLKQNPPGTIVKKSREESQTKCDFLRKSG